MTGCLGCERQGRQLVELAPFFRRLSTFPDRQAMAMEQSSSAGVKPIHAGRDHVISGSQP